MLERLGRYAVTGKLGQGGMGVVYEGFDEKLRRRVALKVLAEPADASGRERLLREARAAAALTHPNVCQIYEIGEDADDLFLALEYLEGRALNEVLAEGPLPRAEAVDVARRVLGALEALHGAGLVHRDLKPSNLFLTRTGPKLLDFGLARRSLAEGPDELALTRPGVAVGTPYYMAPEQWRGETATAAVDLYAMGAVLYEMLTGSPPFTGKTPFEVCDAALNRHPPALAGDRVVALDRVVQRALAKRPAGRFASAGDMAAALAAVGGAGSSAEDVPVHAVKR
ncbi:MAG TPA: serine/threonine-protein kinase, partial [bacterium]|nr:serine/threonine-protein kinase [bacterium]